MKYDSKFVVAASINFKDFKYLYLKEIKSMPEKEKMFSDGIPKIISVVTQLNTRPKL